MWQVFSIFQVQFHLSITHDPMLHVLSIRMCCPEQPWSHHPGTVQKVRGWGSFWCALVAMVSLVEGWTGWSWGSFPALSIQWLHDCGSTSVDFTAEMFSVCISSLPLHSRHKAEAKPSLNGSLSIFFLTKGWRDHSRKKHLGALTSFEAAASLQTKMLSI